MDPDREIKILKIRLKDENKRCKFWEDTSKKHEKESIKYRKLLNESHALIGRITHQLSRRWDSVLLSDYLSGMEPK